MECYDASTHVYYPHHEEYVGPRSDLRGRCVRCREITDAAKAKAASASALMGYAAGDRVVYRGNDRHYRRGEVYVVTEVTRDPCHVGDDGPAYVRLAGVKRYDAGWIPAADVTRP